jgi:hypothetical protein
MHARVLNFSIVPHQTDRMNTAHIHIEPVIATWVLRQLEFTGYNAQLYESEYHICIAG